MSRPFTARHVGRLEARQRLGELGREKAQILKRNPRLSSQTSPGGALNQSEESLPLLHTAILKKARVN